LVSLRTINVSEIPELLGEWRNGAGSLAERLAAGVEQAIERGELLEHWRLPSERDLARELGISRSTTVRSMELLAERGTVQRVHGSGTFIAGNRYPSRTSALPPSLRLKYQLGSNTDPGMIAATVPSPSDLPPEALTLSVGELFEASPGGERPGSGYNLAGLADTRRRIAAMLTAQGLPSAAENLIITTGATQSLSLVFEQTLMPGDLVVVESPSYPTTLDMLRRLGAQIVSVRTGDGSVDSDGLARVALKARAKMVVVTTTCNVATGLSADRAMRNALVGLAQAGVTVVDDLTLADYHPAPQPDALAAMNDHRNIVSVGSFNKIYWGGLRIGWLRSHPSPVQTFIRAKSKTDAGSSVPSQIILSKLLPYHDQIAATRRAQVAARAHDAARYLEAELPDWVIEGAGQGPSMWVRLPVRDSAEFVTFAHARGTSIGYGGMYRSDGRASQHVRLTLTSGDDQVAAGLSNLRDAWEAFPGRRGSRQGKAR